MTQLLESINIFNFIKLLVFLFERLCDILQILFYGRKLLFPIVVPTFGGEPPGPALDVKEHCLAGEAGVHPGEPLLLGGVSTSRLGTSISQIKVLFGY